VGNFNLATGRDDQRRRMLETFSLIVLWLFVINLGIVFGAGVYESRIMVPQWVSYSADTGYLWNGDAARRVDVGMRFWVFASTLPLTMLTLTNFVFVWLMPEPTRAWWLSATAAAVTERLMTFAYFIPAMVKLMRHGEYDDQVAAVKALQWARLAYVRLGVTLAAWLLAMMALSVSGNHGG
jgi:hypothetical protein